MRSRVRLKCSPTSSSVRGSPRSRPKRSLRISRSRSSRGGRSRVISSGGGAGGGGGGEEPVDVVREERGGRHLEGGLRGAVLDDVAQLGVAVLAERLAQR